MANELTLHYGTTGKTVYHLLFNTTGQVYNGSTFVTPSASSWSTYAISTTEASTTGIYEASMPTGLSAGTYFASSYVQAGGSAATTDTLVGNSGPVNWDGTAEGSVDIRSLFGSKQAAFGMSVFGRLIIGGTISSDATPTATSFTANTTGVSGLSSINGIYAGMFVAFYSGANAPKAYKCTAYSYSGTVGTFTVEAMAAVPSVGDFFGTTGRF